MKKRYTYKLSDTFLTAENPAKEGDMQEVEGLMSFSLPDVEAGSEEVSGHSGLMGTLELVDWTNIGALNTTLTFAGIPDNIDFLTRPGVHLVKLTWAEAYTTKDGDEGWNAYQVETRMKLKKFPGGDGEKGSNRENEFVFTNLTYIFRKGTGEPGNFNTIFNYDPANGIIEFNGENIAKDLDKLLGRQ